jgi:hypothetical protein
VIKLTKEKLLEALHAIQNGTKDAGHFHNELETIITLIVNAADDDITAAWNDLSTDTK